MIGEELLGNNISILQQPYSALLNHYTDYFHAQ